MTSTLHYFLTEMAEALLSEASAVVGPPRGRSDHQRLLVCDTRLISGSIQLSGAITRARSPSLGSNKNDDGDHMILVRVKWK